MPTVGKGGSNAKSAEQVAKSPGLLAVLVSCLLIGGAGGAAFGYLVLGSHQLPVTEDAKTADEHKVLNVYPGPSEGRFPSDAIEIPLAPIITAMGPEKRTKVRLDLSIIAVHGTEAETPIKSEIREDVIALLWGLSFKDIEGGRGFQNLRTELDDRARIRGRGAVLGLLIGGLVVR